MLKITTALAASLLLCGTAMAVSVTKGQYNAATQFTGLIDPDNLCGNVITVGAVASGEASVNGLGQTWSQTLVQTATASPYGVNTVTCTGTALPLGTAFKNGVAPNNGTLTCTDQGNGLQYTLTTCNGTDGLGQACTSTMTALPANGTNTGFRLDQTNGTLAVGGTPVCAISTQSVLNRSGK